MFGIHVPDPAKCTLFIPAQATPPPNGLPLPVHDIFAIPEIEGSTRRIVSIVFRLPDLPADRYGNQPSISLEIPAELAGQFAEQIYAAAQDAMQL